MLGNFEGLVKKSQSKFRGLRSTGRNQASTRQSSSLDSIVTGFTLIQVEINFFSFETR